MKERIKFSIIIPVYNVELFLNECVSSVISQTYDNYEIILVNDGSTDSSGIQCEEWSAKSEKIIVVHQNNAGVSEARNTGIRNATGDYLLFLDSDDYWYNTTVLERISDRLQLSKADVLSFNYVKVFNEKQTHPYFNTSQNMPLNLNGFETLTYISKKHLWIASAWNKVISRTLFDRNNLWFKTGVTSEDIDWCLRLAINANHFDFISDIMLCYRQRTGSSSNELSLEKLTNLCNNIDECLSLLKKVPQQTTNLLKPYVAYQYATFIYDVAQAGADVQKQLFPQLEQNRTILEWSHNKKVKLIRYVVQLIGIRKTLLLLEIKAKFMQWRYV